MHDHRNLWENLQNFLTRHFTPIASSDPLWSTSIWEKWNPTMKRCQLQLFQSDGRWVFFVVICYEETITDAVLFATGKQRATSNYSQILEINVAEVVANQQDVSSDLLNVLQKRHIVIVPLVQKRNDKVAVHVRAVGVLGSIHEISVRRRISVIIGEPMCRSATN